MKYLKGTCTLPLILSANRTSILKWWVDAAFAVHPNMQGHSGGGLSLKRGFPIVSSTKQKLNTQSSMESETVGADDFMPGICWTGYFMEAQGYQVQDNILFQDNKSAILLEKNGKASSSKCTKHVNIWYFFITDHVDQGEVSLVLTEITQPCVHTCKGLFICQLYLLPDLLEEMDCKEDTPLTLPCASFVTPSQLIIVI
jgi:hypothetical protein